MTNQRQIFLHGALGQRHLREVLTGQFAGLLLCPDVIWLVSPWVSDFPVMDNRTGEWDTLDPSWGHREIGFLELLATSIIAGCSLRMATINDGKSVGFINKLTNRLPPEADFKFLETENLHTKGLLTRRFFLKGSMNYTYKGAKINDEHLMLTNDNTIISEALIEFQERYIFGEHL